MLAANIGVEYDELAPLLDERIAVVEIDRDEVWWKISEHLAKRLGELMAARKELNKALQKDRAARAARIAGQKNRGRKVRPRARD